MQITQTGERMPHPVRVSFSLMIKCWKQAMKKKKSRMHLWMLEYIPGKPPSTIAALEHNCRYLHSAQTFKCCEQLQSSPHNTQRESELRLSSDDLGPAWEISLALRAICQFSFHYDMWPIAINFNLAHKQRVTSFSKPASTTREFPGLPSLNHRGSSAVATAAVLLLHCWKSLRFN